MTRMHLVTTPSWQMNCPRWLLTGIKTATCDDLWSYEAEDLPLPYVGEWWIVIDGSGLPVAVTETPEVELRRYNEVDAAFAFDEGRG